MIKKIDRYIIKKYLTTFFFTVILITMVSIVIDFAERINKLIGQPIAFHEIVFDYYLPFIPWINSLMWPLMSMISVIFFTSRLARDSEIVALLSAGVSYKRLMIPYLLSAIIIASLLWYGNNYIIPNSTKIKNEFEVKYIKKSNKKNLTNNIHFFIGPKEKVFIRYYKFRDSTAYNFRLEKFNGTEINYFLKAKKLSFKNPPNEWTLHDYEKRTFYGDKETYIKANGENMDTLLNFTPQDFVRHAKQMEMMTTADLIDFIDREKERGLNAAKNYQIELYRRTADPFSILILTLIGMSVASRKVRGGMGLHLAIGVVLGSAFVLLIKFSATFSNNLSLSPLLGVWIPNILFSFVAFYLVYKAQK